jgi:hypothetical protein
LNVIQNTDQRDDEDGDFNNGEQYTALGNESQALEGNEDRVHNQGNCPIQIVYFS